MKDFTPEEVSELLSLITKAKSICVSKYAYSTATLLRDAEKLIRKELNDKYTTDILKAINEAK